METSLVLTICTQHQNPDGHILLPPPHRGAQNWGGQYLKVFNIEGGSTCHNASLCSYSVTTKGCQTLRGEVPMGAQHWGGSTYGCPTLRRKCLPVHGGLCWAAWWHTRGYGTHLKHTLQQLDIAEIYIILYTINKVFGLELVISLKSVYLFTLFLGCLLKSQLVANG